MIGTFNRVVLTLVVACVGIAPVFGSLWPKWTDSFTYSHGLLVVPLCAWLLWREKDRINAEPVAPLVWGALPLAGLLFLWTFSFAASIEIGVEALLPAILLLAVMTACGWRVAVIASVPVLLLYSAIPVWDLINGVLQNMTTVAVDVILGVLQVPAYIQGNIVQIPSGVFEIAGGCSGLHFFIVALTLAVVYGHLYYTSLRDKALLLGIAAAMAIVMNWVRVATIITAGHLTNMQSYLVQVDHYNFGWALFAVLLIPFFLIARRLESDADDRTDISMAIFASKPVGSPVATVLVAVILLLPALVWGRLVQNETQPVEIGLPAIAGIAGPTAYAGNWAPRFSNPDGETTGSYIAAGVQIDVYANWYFTQSQERELIGSGNSVTGPRLLQMAAQPDIDKNARKHAKSLEIREIIAGSGASDRRLIWYHYLVGQAGETSPIKAKLRQGWQSIAGGEGSGLVSVSVKCETGDPQCESARRLLEQEFARIDEAVSQTLIALARS